MRSSKSISSSTIRKLIFASALCALAAGCHLSNGKGRPSISFTTVPAADKGGPDVLTRIEGKVSGARPGQSIVVYARSGVWFLQPSANEPFAHIQSDSRWQESTHFGTEYAAFLVEQDYRPPATTDVLPKLGGAIVAMATVRGAPPSGPIHRTLRFSGYEWIVRAAPSDRGGATNIYDPANSWTGADGALHLRIADRAGRATCAEVNLTRSLGYGTYRFVIRETSNLPPLAVLGMFTWDGVAAEQNHREMDIEISRWGDPANKNAQFVIQPFYVPANVERFKAPSGQLTCSFRWEPGRVSFNTVHGKESNRGSTPVAQHVFTSGVPSAGDELVHINLYVFGNNSSAGNESEVVIESFEFLP